MHAAPPPASTVRSDELRHHTPRESPVRISEVFFSIQGEGKLAGVPSAFIRTTGCNLRCVWCDSPATSWTPVGEEFRIEEVLERLRAFPTRHAVLTGGEPLLAAGVEELTRRLRGAGYHLTIETAATVWKDVECDLASISPKLGHSTPWEREGGRFAARHEAERINVEVIRRFQRLGEHQLKFVVRVPEDIGEIDSLLERIGVYRPEDVLLMPEGVDRETLALRAPWVADLCKQRGFRFCPRLHIELYGHRPGT